MTVTKGAHHRGPFFCAVSFENWRQGMNPMMHVSASIRLPILIVSNSAAIP